MLKIESSAFAGALGKKIRKRIKEFRVARSAIEPLQNEYRLAIPKT
jgi:hypothetical protein